MAFPQIQKEFQIRKSRTYLNNASIAPMADRVVSAVNSFMEDVRHNGRNNYPKWVRHADTVIRDKMARLIGAERSEVAFLKNTTEGLSIVANGIDWREGDNVIIADIEYPSNVYCWLNLKRRGVAVKWFPAREHGGRIPSERLAELVDSRTRLISLSSVQFSNGFKSDLAAVGELCRKKNLYLNLDAIQWLGSLHINVKDYNIHFMSAGGHKWLMAPIGTGLFYIRQDVLEEVHPYSVGFHTVEKSEDHSEDHMNYDLSALRPNASRFEEALVNYPGIWGFEAALDMFLEVGTQALERHVIELTSFAISEVKRRGYEIVSSEIPGERSGIVCFRHPLIQGEELRQRLASARIDVAVREGHVRIAPGIHNDAADIQRLVEALPTARAGRSLAQRSSSSRSPRWAS